MDDFKKVLILHRDIYSNQLKQCLSFWSTYGFDQVLGGFTTYLDQKGRLFSTDKSVWALGRGIGTFAFAYQYIEQNALYLSVAKSSFEFMNKYAYDQDKRMFFLMTKDGKPIQKRRYWFSETFAATGSIQLYAVTNDKKYLDAAVQSYETFRNLYYHPLNSSSKYVSTTINGLSLAPSMILLKTAQIMRNYDKIRINMYNEDIDYAIKQIINNHYSEKEKSVFEFVSLIPHENKSPRDRLINPGHAIEAAWFLLDEYLENPKKYPELLLISENIVNWMVEKGWDQQFGGLLSFVDSEGFPPEQLEWDMKLWWPQTELLIASLKLFLITNKVEYFELYNKTFDYLFKYFKIDDLEWIGYLHRDNTPASFLKGNLFKGPFHIPRMLSINYLLIKKYLDENQNK